MSEDNPLPWEQKVEHSHSRMTKLVDELKAIAEAIRSHGTYESHHREECQLFLEQLQREFASHVDYEEEELFPDLRDHVPEEDDDTIERAIQEHEELGRLLDELEHRAEGLQPGRKVEATEVRDLLNGIETLRQQTHVHDETEHELFESVEPAD